MGQQLTGISVGSLRRLLEKHDADVPVCILVQGDQNMVVLPVDNRLGHNQDKTLVVLSAKAGASYENCDVQSILDRFKNEVVSKDDWETDSIFFAKILDVVSELFGKEKAVKTMIRSACAYALVNGFSASDVLQLIGERLADAKQENEGAQKH